MAGNAKPENRKPTYILFIFAQARSRSGMDASPADLDIHGQNTGKSAVASAYCHGCPESPKLGIHDDIHGPPPSSAIIMRSWPLPETRSIGSRRRGDPVARRPLGSVVALALALATRRHRSQAEQQLTPAEKRKRQGEWGDVVQEPKQQEGG